MRPSGAAAVIIGNEVLSAKVEDQNGPHLIRRLRERGVPLRHLAMVPDEVDAIVEALTVARRHARYVFTSGGIGPTHDDVTVRAVALALGKPVVRLPEVEALLRQHYGEKPPAAALRLAEAPMGTELLFQEGIWYPVLVCDELFLLPGVPQLFRQQLEAVLPRIVGVPVVVRCLYLAAQEAEIAHVLDRVALAMPKVQIGSYPTLDRDAGYKVKVTVEHSDAGLVDEVVAQLTAALPPGSVQRVDEAR
ncbi:MAG: competence/damage-inducible protein A [Myxococcota bacterium]